jgi:predicted hydrolase (HD superfamily)
VGHVRWARELAERLLADAIPRRWSHTRGVADKAASLAYIVGQDADRLVCAAWLHDIGYAPPLVAAGFHPLDGARYLRDVAGADGLLCRLVAHHSCATVEARRRGLAGELVGEFPPVGGLVADALTYCDMTTSPDGDPVDVATRLAEVTARYGVGDPVTEAIEEARPQIEESVRAVRAALG